jgi:hypothetical protein
MKSVVLLFIAMVFASAQVPPPSDGKVRVYVADSQSWEVTGWWSYSKKTGSGYERGGARPQTAEIIKTFNERCPEVTVTNNKDRANFAVVLDHEGGKGWLQHKNKVAVFNRAGDVIFSASTLSLGNSVKGACDAITMAPASADETVPAASPAKPIPTAAITAQPEIIPVTPVKTAPLQTVSPQTESNRLPSCSASSLGCFATSGTHPSYPRHHSSGFIPPSGCRREWPGVRYVRFKSSGCHCVFQRDDICRHSVCDEAPARQVPS